MAGGGRRGGGRGGGGGGGHDHIRPRYPIQQQKKERKEEANVLCANFDFIFPSLLYFLDYYCYCC